jgi:(p)ppGpp synthase/HD superfamily hydrolase
MAVPLVKLADHLAEQAHLGQVDKAGEPYISHPRRVAARVADDPYAAATALLHDTLEDTALTERQLRHHMPPAVVEAVVLLTRLPEQEAGAYYAAIRSHPLALRVKLADLADNSDPARLAALDEATSQRLREKYARAYRALTDD